MRGVRFQFWTVVALVVFLVAYFVFALAVKAFS